MTTTDSADQVSRGARRRARTRARLLAATRALIVEKGVEGLRIDQITDRADVAFGTFYNHFESKEQIVDAVVDEAIGSLQRAIAESGVGLVAPEEAAIAPLRRIIRLTTDDPDVAALVVGLDQAGATFMEAVYPYAVRELRHLVEQGRFDIPDVEVTVTGIMGGTLAVMRRILGGELPATADSSYAEWVLRSFGIDGERAREAASHPLPEFRQLGARPLVPSEPGQPG